MAGSWRWALVLAWPLACLNPMPDDFPNQHEDDRTVAPAPGEADPQSPPSTADEEDQAPNPEGEGLAGGVDANGAPAASSAPDAGAPPADAGTEEDDVSP